MSSTLVSSSISIIPPNNPVTYIGNSGALVTVPAGKTLYVTGIAMYSISSDVTTTGVVKVDATNTFIAALSAYGGTSVTGAPVLVATSGEVLTYTDHTKIQITIWGFLQ